jgi:hypothetical protein
MVIDFTFGVVESHNDTQGTLVGGDVVGVEEPSRRCKGKNTFKDCITPYFSVKDVRRR